MVPSQVRRAVKTQICPLISQAIKTAERTVLIPLLLFLLHLSSSFREILFVLYSVTCCRLLKAKCVSLAQ